MKKNKGPRAIPDFSRHTPRDASGSAPKGTARAGDASTPAPAGPRQTIKPRATSAKSGRRGQ